MSFHFLHSVPWYVEAFDFDEAQFFFFFFFAAVACAFRAISKKSWPNPRSWRLIPIFYSQSFMVLALTFRSLIYFEFLYMIWSTGTTSFFCMWIFTCLSTISWRHCSFFIEWSWNPCQKNQLTIVYWRNLFLDFPFYSIVLYIFIPAQHCFDWSSFAVNFETGKCESFTFILVQDCFEQTWVPSVTCNPVKILGSAFLFL